MPSVEQLLKLGEVESEPLASARSGKVLITQGNQLIGTYADLCKFRSTDSAYAGWQAHHVFETQDLERMHVDHVAPGRDDQLCVLLPERAHIGRINSVLRRYAPLGMILTPRSLLDAYREAYDLVGDYCGGGELMIKRELVGIVKGTLRAYRLM